MKNKGIVIFLIVLAVIIVAVMVGDWISKRPDKMGANPFEYKIDEFKNVDPALIHYKESKNFKIGFDKPSGISIEDEKIYLTGDSTLKIIDFSGTLINEITLPDKPNTVEVSGENIFIAFKKQVQVYNEAGIKKGGWALEHDNSYITALVVSKGNVFVADAGTRKIIRFSEEGEKLSEFEGKTSEDALHGFIVPSPYFDIDVNEDGELWVVNPGLHSLENYTTKGELRTYWQSFGINIEGFSGCCNPAHFTFLQDGSFVTSEKGMVRIKVYKPSGEFSGVVAAPNKFNDEGEAPDLAVDASENIYALDFDRKIVRVFELK